MKTKIFLCLSNDCRLAQ